jgi:hypothetical protein
MPQIGASNVSGIVDVHRELRLKTFGWHDGVAVTGYGTFCAVRLTVAYPRPQSADP